MRLFRDDFITDFLDFFAADVYNFSSNSSNQKTKHPRQVVGEAYFGRKHGQTTIRTICKQKKSSRSFEKPVLRNFRKRNGTGKQHHKMLHSSWSIIKTFALHSFSVASSPPRELDVENPPEELESSHGGGGLCKKCQACKWKHVFNEANERLLKNTVGP